MIDLLKTACRFLGVNEDSVNAEVFFVKETEIQEFNKAARGVDKPTDVLSFPTLELRAGEIPVVEAHSLDVNPDTGKLELGDIIICRKHAKMPISFLIVHGFLHLLGYDHQTDADYDVMMRITGAILKKYGK